MRRPAPRWAKWSRGVRTRGLRVGLVGGPRPLYFYGPGFLETWALSFHWPDSPSEDHPLDFPGKWLNIRHEDELEVIRLRINEAADHPQVGASPQSTLYRRTLWHF
jgi:hypothetical protein